MQGKSSRTYLLKTFSLVTCQKEASIQREMGENVKTIKELTFINSKHYNTYIN